MNLVNVVQAGPLGFTIGSQDDSVGYGGGDLVIVTDPDGATAPLAGNYGVPYYIKTGAC
jgi:hypothetical protein